MAELKSGNRNHMTHNVVRVCYLALHRNSLLLPARLDNVFATASLFSVSMSLELFKKDST